MHVELNKDTIKVVPEFITELKTEQEALVAFLSYKNTRFDESLYSGSVKEITFDEAWLMEHIFVQKP